MNQINIAMRQVSNNDFDYALNKGLIVNEEGKVFEKNSSSRQVKMEFVEERMLGEWEDEDYSLLFRGDRVSRQKVAS